MADLTTKPSCRGLNAAAKDAHLVIEDLHKKAKEAKLVLLLFYCVTVIKIVCFQNKSFKICMQYFLR